MCNEICTLSTSHRSAIIWLGGDLNLPDIDWESQTIQGNRYPIAVNNIFLEMTRECCLEQKIKFPTRMDRTLDIFLTNRPSLVNRSEPLPGISDHDIVFVDSNIVAKRRKPIRRRIYIWKRANIEELISGAEKINLDFHQNFDTTSCIEEMWKYISTELTNLLDTAVPSKISSVRYHQAWITGDIKRLTRRKKKAYTKAIRSRDPADLHRYQELKKASRRACMEAYATCIYARHY
jgi:hypothetical protein